MCCIVFVLSSHPLVLLIITKTKKEPAIKQVPFGALKRIRTHDLLVRSQTLYPTELPAQIAVLF